MIDSHCHLAGEEFAADRDAVIARARSAGIDRALVILAAENDAEWAGGQEVARAWDAVRFAVGVHPHQAHVFAADPAAAAAAVATRLDASPLVCAVGEIGLDYHYDFSPRDVQQAVFRAQLALAQARHLPVVIHTREAEADTLALIVEAQARGPLAGVFHCFTGGPEVADAGAGDRLLPVVCRHRDLPARGRAARCPAAGPAGAAAGRDRRPLSGAGAASRPAQRAGVGDDHGRGGGPRAGPHGRGAGCRVRDNYDRLFAARGPQISPAQGLSTPSPR